MRNAFLSRCYAEPSQWGPDGLIDLDAEESRHLSRVLHARMGDRVDVFDGQGRRAEASVLKAGPVIRLQTLNVVVDPLPAVHMRLLLGMPREAHLDWILQKGTELGMSELAVFCAEHSIVQLSEAAAEKKRARWSRIVRDAAKQSGWNRFPLITWFPSLEAALKAPKSPEECRILLSLAPSAISFREALNRGRALHKRRWTLCVGPEGDYSPSEMHQLRSVSDYEATLGTCIFRVETAALYALSVLRHETNFAE